MMMLRSALLGAMLGVAGTAHAVVAIDQFNLVPIRTGYTLAGSGISTRNLSDANGPYTRTITQTQTLTAGVTGLLDRIGLQISGNTLLHFTLYSGNPNAEDNDAQIIADFTRMPVTGAAASTGAVTIFDLRSLNYTVTAGQTLSLMANAPSTTGSLVWALGNYDENFEEVYDGLAYASGFNTYSTNLYYGPNSPNNSNISQETGLDRGFITWINAATSAANPLTGAAMGPNGAETFSFTPNAGERVFIDPVYATGFDYVVNSGSNILDVLFPSLASDADGYSIFALDGTMLGTISGGGIYTFAAGGVGGFRVRGIDGLEEGAPFVTGLTFAGTGAVSITQTPVAAVPEPASWALMIGGFGLTGGMLRRRARLAAVIA